MEMNIFEGSSLKGGVAPLVTEKPFMTTGTRFLGESKKVIAASFLIFYIQEYYDVLARACHYE